MVPAVLRRSPLPLVGVDSDTDASPSGSSALLRHRHRRLDPPPPLLPTSSSPTPPLPPSSSASRPSSATRHAREVSSRYRSPLPAPPSDAAQSTRSRSPSLHSSSRRFSSPSVDRAAAAVDSAPFSPSLKRAVSAERRRVSADAGGGVMVRQRSVGSGAGARSDLWPPSNRSLYASMQAEPPCPPTPSSAGVGNTRSFSSNSSSDQTLKPSANAAPQRLSSSPDRRKGTPERKGTPLQRHRNAVDQAENAKPPLSESRTGASAAHKPEAALVVRHRWPSSLSGLKLYGAAMTANKSIDLCSAAAASVPPPAPPERPPSRSSSRSSVNLLQSRPTSFSSQVIPARIFSHTINDGPASAALRAAARKLSLESKLRHRSGSGGESPSPSLKKAPPQRSSDLTTPPPPDLVRRFDHNNDTAELASVSAEFDTISGTGSAVESESPRLSQEFGIWKSNNYGRSRTPSDHISKVRAAAEPAGGYGAMVVAGMRLPPSRVQKSSAEAAAWLPYMGVPPAYGKYGVHQQNLLSPAKLQSSPMRSRGASPSPSPSTSSASSSPGVALHYGVDFRRTKKGLSLVEAVYLHRILHNRLLQWRFANARAEYANTTQRHAGEKQLFSVWAKTAEIRKSVTTKRLKLQQARQAQKINSILRSQGCKLEYWSSIQHEHNYALSGAVEALEAAVLRLPVDEGVKAETQAVKEAMASAVEVVKAIEISINQLLPKMEKTNMLISELAQIADQERTLLEECGDVLLIVSSLEVEESSLRMQLLQFEQEKARVLGLLMMDGHGSGTGPL